MKYLTRDKMLTRDQKEIIKI